MFETLFVGDGSRRRRLRQTLTLFLSLTVHAAVVAAVIVVPLLRADASLPGYKIIDAALVAPPILPGPPPGRSGRPNNGPAGPTKEGKNPPIVIGSHKFLAPIEIPTEIVEEDPTKGLPEGTGSPDGVDGGVGDGRIPWIIGEEILPEEVNSFAKAITIVQPPRLIKKVNPAYSPIAISAHVSGTVIIEAVTDIYGRVRQARVVSGHPLLSGAALEAVCEWLYEPYLVNGIPKPVSFTVTITFALAGR